MMATELPSKFVRTTRWAYLQDGVEIGPYDANEIVQLLSAREIAPDTTLVEINTRWMCPVSEVGPFARVIVDIVKETRRKKADQDFADTTRDVASGGRKRVLLITLLILAAVGVGGTALFIYNPFAVKPVAEDHGQQVNPTAGKQADQTPLKKAEEKKEPAFKITEMDPSELEPDPQSEMIESVLEEKLLSPNADHLGDDEKLEGVVKMNHAKPAPNGFRKADASGNEGQGGNSGIQTMDFSEDEIAAGDGPRGPDDTLAVARLRKVMRRCVERSLQKFPAGEEVLIDASARLQPDGRLTGLKIDLMPRKAVGEIKMCVSAELMRMRVPAFEGNAVPLSAAVAVPGR
jgi:hypothetical protein